ncbi:MAG: hypothetical protein M0Q49_01870 [Porticoccaceae bacterium]|nr:hypothetical protein [Porticoccaceae bacterium]
MEYLQHKAAWFPARHCRILHLRLSLAPTLGQLRLLEATNSPFMMGGKVAAADCAVALHILARPWRQMRRALGRESRWLRWRLVWLAWHLRQPARLASTATALTNLVEQALWLPEAFSRQEPGGSTAGSFSLASGLALRLALRANELNLAALTPGRRPRSVWDLSIAEVLAATVAVAELQGSEYLTRAEFEEFNE